MSTFTSKSDFYSNQLAIVAAKSIDSLKHLLPPDVAQLLDGLDPQSTVRTMLEDISIGDLILDLLGTAGALAESMLYISLFLIFMLAGHGSLEKARGPIVQKIDKQVFIYIRGKVSIYLLVGALDCTVYYMVGLDLWLVFGVVAFFLAFIPNIGLAISVCLPMPIVVLDPSFSLLTTAIAFLGPCVIGVIAKDILEPMILGNATSLHPIVVLLSIMFFGSMWGITGMVMAVPMTAVIRLVVTNVDHPITCFMAETLAGTSAPPLPGSGLKMPHMPQPATYLFGKRPREVAADNKENQSLV